MNVSVDFSNYLPRFPQPDDSPAPDPESDPTAGVDDFGLQHKWLVSFVRMCACVCVPKLFVLFILKFV